MARMHTRAVWSKQTEQVTQRDRRRGGICRWRSAAALLAGAMSMLTIASPAHAGAVLLSRQSTLQAAGGGKTVGYDLTDGTTNFDDYANDISNSAGAWATSSAHQFSEPQAIGNLLQGAYAEGTVQASRSVSDGTATARSVFDLTFEVTQTPVQYTIGGAFGSAGSGVTVAELTNLKSPGDAVFITTTDASHGPSHEIDKQGFLPPGTYGLKVWANTPGTSASGSAYYTVNLTLNPVSGGSGSKPVSQGSGMPHGTGAAAAPLPPAVWTGLMMLGGMGVMMFRSRSDGGMSRT